MMDNKKIAFVQQSFKYYYYMSQTMMCYYQMCYLKLYKIKY